MDPIKTIDYFDMRGAFLWSEPMIFPSLFTIGDDITEKGVRYVVREVRVQNAAQRVTLAQEITNKSSAASL